MSVPMTAPSRDLTQILIVDDEQGILEILQEFLVPEAFEVTTATKAVEALQVMTRKRFDVILADLVMPEIDGFQFINYLRANDLNAKTPVVVYSGYLDEKNLLKLRAMEINSIAAKPANPDELVRLLRDSIDEPPLPTVYATSLVEDFKTAVADGCSEIFGLTPELGEPICLAEGRGSAHLGAVLTVFGAHLFGSVGLAAPLTLRSVWERGHPDFFAKSSAGLPRKVLLEELLEAVGRRLRYRLKSKKVFIALGISEVSGVAREGLQHRVSNIILSIPVDIGGVFVTFEGCFASSDQGNRHRSDDFDYPILEPAGNQTL